jgi:hypothetical protein
MLDAPRPTFTLLALAAAGIVGAGAVACTGSGKHEAASLVEAVDRFRAADNATKPARAQAVAGVGCSDAKVCDAKQACLAAIDPTARAMALKDEVSQRLDDIEQKRLAPDSAPAQALPEKLDEAGRLLQQGRAKMPDCEKKLADLRIAFGV